MELDTYQPYKFPKRILAVLDPVEKPCGLLQLTHEITLIIIQNLPIISRTNLALTCKRFAKFTTELNLLDHRGRPLTDYDTGYDYLLHGDADNTTDAWASHIRDCGVLEIHSMSVWCLDHVSDQDKTSIKNFHEWASELSVQCRGRPWSRGIAHILASQAWMASYDSELMCTMEAGNFSMGAIRSHMVDLGYTEDGQSKMLAEHPYETSGVHRIDLVRDLLNELDLRGEEPSFDAGDLPGLRCANDTYGSMLSSDEPKWFGEVALTRTPKIG